MLPGLPGLLVDSCVGEAEGLLERPPVPQGLRERLQRQGARDLAGRVAAHPVRHGDEDPSVRQLLGEHRVLLVGSPPWDGLDREPRIVRHACTSERWRVLRMERPLQIESVMGTSKDAGDSGTGRLVLP